MPRVIILPPEGPAGADDVKLGGWWHELEDKDGRVMCDVCPRHCTLRSGDRGFCFVRENRDGQMVSTTYGRSTGFCIDPIEKKPLNQFYPGTSVLSFGTAGCNLACVFCQNWSTSKSRDVQAACQIATPQTIAEAARQLGCRSVAFTYNDPIIWLEYAIDTARACRALGLKTVAVTSGYIAPEARAAFYGVMDAANIDLKAFSEDFYAKMTGGHLQPVLDTLRWVAHETDAWLEITNLVIPQSNDSVEEIGRMCTWIAEELGPDVPLHFSAFHPDFQLTDRGPTPLETLLAAHDVARRAGLRYVYVGNISDRRHQGTYCPGCGQLVIERDGYQVGAYEVRDGHCAACGTPIAGRFDAAPGHWGGRRQPVDIAAYVAKQPSPAAPLSPQERGTADPSSLPQQRSLPQQQREVALGQPGLSSEQEQRLVRAAGGRVAAAVNNQPSEPMADVLADVAELPVYGVFVSLKRGRQLRSCCGYLGGSIRLAEALDQAAVRAAKEDPRFPSISPSELSHLDMEVWLLWGPQTVAAQGEARAEAFTIGRHGLQIARGASRGLLLPGVAVEHKLDARGFLRQVCLKAGLPGDAWTEDDTTLMTFEGYAIHGRIDAPEEKPSAVSEGPTAAELAALVEFCRANLVALLDGATPSYYLLDGFDGEVHGVVLQIEIPARSEQLQCSKLSLRPGMPLQATLFGLSETAAAMLRDRGIDAQAASSLSFNLAVLRDPVLHGNTEELDLQGIDPRRRALLVADAFRSAWVYNPGQTVQAVLGEAMRLAGLTEGAEAEVVSLAAYCTAAPMACAHVPRPQAGPEVRPPAVAGTFYPGRPEQVQAAIDELLPEKPQPEPWSAVMVPHAAWQYSGRLAMAALSQVKLPEQVIVLCPRHRGAGVQWAVAPHRRWGLPGGELAADPDLAQRLAAAITGLELDAAAHRDEHAIEVHLPLLARLSPGIRVVGIAIGGGRLPALIRFAEQMAGVLRDMSQRPLLVVSSDLNHFADDAETRRLDRLVLEAMQSLDPVRLYDTVRKNHISMCGVSPAVIVMETLRQLDCLHRCELVGYTTSAEASGDSRRVVGYAGMLLG
jgi:AmmeMemoRadiSam system radical SAM enzyme/AmmeMemoRadiSam system protein B/AmmeMemoRadiSam system protein A